MLDNIMYGTKIIVLLAFVISIRKCSSGNGNDGVCITLFGFLLFVTGMEMVIHSETPWQFLASEANNSEWTKALLGGSVMLILPVILFALTGKDIEKLFGSSKAKKNRG